MDSPPSSPPVIGQIVHYKLNPLDCQQPVAGRYNTMHPGQVCPAMIVAVFHGDCANLQVFLDGDASLWATSRLRGNDQGQWTYRRL